MAKEPLGVEQVLALLTATPDRIAAITAPLTADRLHEPPSPGEWSANEVLAHLRACADVWGECIVAMLDADRPTIRAVNPRTWIERTDYGEQRFRPSLRAFAAQRADLLAVLDPLEPAGWERGAAVTGAGKPVERTVHFYAAWIARHERTHLKQFQKTVDVLLG